MGDICWPKKIYQWTPHGRSRRGRTATVMEKPRDGLHEKQKHGRRYGYIYPEILKFIGNRAYLQV